jgi:Restriction endonuclease EcoRV
MSLDLPQWLRDRCAEYRFDVGGIFLRSGDHAWPLTAVDARDLEARLDAGGHLLALPKEPAALANVLEVSLVDFLVAAAGRESGLDVRHGTERGYPDLEFSGAALDGAFHAVDVKVARRAPSKRKTQSRITLYTGNTYFKFPDLVWPGTFRPFSQYATHLDILIIYTLNRATKGRVEDPELIVHDAWRLGSRERSSTTREYLGAVNDLDRLRNGTGDFQTAEEFYRYWRAFGFRLSKQVQNQLDKLVREQGAEIERLRRR